MFMFVVLTAVAVVEDEDDADIVVAMSRLLAMPTVAGVC